MEGNIMLIASSFKKVLVITAVAGNLSLSAALFDVSHANIRTQAIITVYSDGKVMATYEAVDQGRMDNDCYVFHVKKGVREPEVRVCGTFTVEQVR
jgi:hypothetical protein